MRKALVLFHMAGLLVAADPPYFTDVIEGWAFPDLVARDKVVITPGTLVDCKPLHSSPTYSSSECKLQGTDFKITTGGKTLTFPMTKITVSEYQYDPKQPSTLSYYLNGEYRETLPDNSVFESVARLSLERFGSMPGKVRGHFTLQGVGNSFPIVADIK